MARRERIDEINASYIRKQAELIRDVAQRIIDDCIAGKPRFDAYARNKATGGGLAQDGAVLGIMIVQYEYELEKEE